MLLYLASSMGNRIDIDHNDVSIFIVLFFNFIAKLHFLTSYSIGFLVVHAVCQIPEFLLVNTLWRI